MKRPFILGVNGSPNSNGRVAKMLGGAMHALKKQGAQTKLINLVNYKILPPSGKLNAKIYIERTKDDMPKLQKLVLEADGVIFATPTHWFNVSSLMKLFLDRLTSLEHYNFLMEGKVAGFITYGPQGGALNAAMALIIFANQMGMVIPPYATIFDEGRGDSWAMRKEHELLAKNMIQQIYAWRNGRLHWGYPDEKYEISPIELLPKKRLNRK